MLFYLLMLFH